MFRLMNQARTASTRNGTIGRPGTSDNRPSMAARMDRARGYDVSWRPSSSPKLFREAARVTSKPAAMEVTSAGICDTRPSPMDSSV